MIIGVPSEVKNNESRVGLTPQSVKKIVNSGHDVLIQKNAGANIGFFDDQYLAAGAKLKDIAEEVVRVVSPNAKIKYQSSDRGWVGDVPKFIYSIEKIKKLGWN